MGQKEREEGREDAVLYKKEEESLIDGHVMLSFAGTAQEAGAGGRSGGSWYPCSQFSDEWAVPANENIARPRLLDEKPKRREQFQNTIQR